MNLVMPMAGRGSRFADVGYRVPKPMIDVLGKPMYAWATDSLPLKLAKRVIFICLQEHLGGFGLEEDIRKRYAHLDPVVVPLNKVTEGQACTVLEARRYIDRDEPLIIYNADTHCRTNLEATLPALPKAVRGVIGVFQAPGDKWSFARTDAQGRVVEVAEKMRISDWACTGLYHFTSGAEFVAEADAMIAANQRVKNEFYVAPVYDRLIKRGAEVRLDVAPEVWVLGTPEDLEDFHRRYPGAKMSFGGRLPKRVLHVMNGAAGGAALSTLGLIAALRERGVEACVVCDDAGSAEEREALREATSGAVSFTPLYWWNEKIRAKAWKRPLLEVRQWVRTRGRVGEVAEIVRAARRWNADLIHTNTLLTPSGGHAAGLLGLPHVWHLRELIGPGQPFRLPLEGPALGRYLEAHASVVVANSHASAAALRGLLSEARLAVVPNGIALKFFEGLARHPGRQVVIGMVANLTSRVKKHSLFIEAARRAAAPGVEYRIYGHAPPLGADAYADQMRREAEVAGVKIAGFAPPEQIYGELDVLVHTADAESFGRTVVEAMAAGLPVVGVNGGGVGETVAHEQTGLLAAPDAALELAAHFSKLAGDAGLRARLGAAGRQRARERYSLEACAAAMTTVYARAMATPVSSTLSMVPLLMEAVRVERR